MKTIIIATVSILMMLLAGCEPAATFDKPQPDNEKSLTSFSEQLQGNYLSADQASTILITDKLLTRHYDFDFFVHKDSIGATYKLSGDTLINVADATREMVKVKGDTIIRHENWTDTLFNLSEDNVLKKFKGGYFLSKRNGDNSWEVKKLSLKKGVLTVGSISDKSDILKLKEITETTDDTVSTKFTLTRRQFRKFVNRDGFGEREEFTHMTENSK